MRKLALELGVIGLVNAQFAIQNGNVFVLEVNPRASRTVPFISKVTGINLARVAANCMLGLSLDAQKMTQEIELPYFAVKLPSFPFAKFQNADPILGPEMKSTGEVMGIGASFGEAYARGQLGNGVVIPHGGNVFISVRDADKPQAVLIAKELVEQGFELWATRGTAAVITKAGLPCQHINKVMEGRPHIVDMIKNSEIDFIINTTEGKKAIADSYTIRRSALQSKVFYTTTIAGARATLQAMHQQILESVSNLQSLHCGLGKKHTTPEEV